MPTRASHLPHYVERTALQKLRATPALLALHLMPAGPKTRPKSQCRAARRPAPA